MIALELGAPDRRGHARRGHHRPRGRVVATSAATWPRSTGPGRPPRAGAGTPTATADAAANGNGRRRRNGSTADKPIDGRRRPRSWRPIADRSAPASRRRCFGRPVGRSAVSAPHQRVVVRLAHDDARRRGPRRAAGAGARSPGHDPRRRRRCPAGQLLVEGTPRAPPPSPPSAGTLDDGDSGSSSDAARRPRLDAQPAVDRPGLQGRPRRGPRPTPGGPWDTKPLRRRGPVRQRRRRRRRRVE